MTSFHRRWLAVLVFALGGSSCTVRRASQPVCGQAPHTVTARPICYVGYGLVTGLTGRGDGEGFPVTVRLARQLRQEGRIGDVDMAHAAIVAATVEFPVGAPPGSKADVQVSLLGLADSLQGGRLVPTTLSPQLGDRSYAKVEGQVEAIPGTAQGCIRGGATLEYKE